MINGWRVHKIFVMTGHFLSLHIFRYFKPRPTIIGLHYDIEKIIFYVNLVIKINVFELFNYNHLNIVLACLVWYCVFLCLPVIYLTAHWLNQIRFPVLVCRQSNSKWILFMNYVIMKKGRNQSLRSNKFKTEGNNKVKK